MALLELDGVTRRYGALVALDQVAMTVEEGEVRAIIGPNGAGKTTLFNVITGTVKPTAGLIRFADQPIAGLPSHHICRLGISRTFQITALFPEMSARENARLAAQARHPRRWQPFGGARIFKEAQTLADAALEQLGLFLEQQHSGSSQRADVDRLIRRVEYEYPCHVEGEFYAAGQATG